MLTYNLDIFSNLENWQNKKKLTLFTNKKQLDTYQKYFLNIRKKNKKTYKEINLKSSGTTSNVVKEIKFPKIFYETIENHHIWRIMNSHKIKPGNVVKIFQGRRNTLSLESKNKFFGPYKDPSMGLENNCWLLVFNPLEEKNIFFWKEQFNFIKKLKPSFLYTSPSMFVSILDELISENLFFEFPILFSCESLSDNIKKKSEMFFLKSINKMRDWTCGLGFFECSHNKKHIYDELCIVNNKENEIQSIDLFNYCDDVEKTSDDCADVAQFMCDCGIYGNIIKNFEGKIFECLVSRKGKKYSSNYFSNVLRILPFELLEYEIIQDKEKNIIFNTKNKLSDFQTMKISKLLNCLIGDDEKNDTAEFSVFNCNKVVFVSGTSNMHIKFYVKDPKVYKNKIVRVRSYAV